MRLLWMAIILLTLEGMAAAANESWLTAAQFQVEFDRQVGAGNFPARVSVAIIDSQPMYRATFIELDESIDGFWTHHGMTGEYLYQRDAELKAQGYCIIALGRAYNAERDYWIATWVLQNKPVRPCAELPARAS